MHFGKDAVGKIMVGKSGTVVKNKKKLKDENDAYYVVNKKGVVLAYYASSEDYDAALTYKDKNDNEKKISIDGDWLAGDVTPEEYQQKVEDAVNAKKGK